MSTCLMQLRPSPAAAVNAQVSTGGVSNRTHLSNLEHILRRRHAAADGGADASGPPRHPLLRLPSFFRRPRGAVEEPADVSPRSLARLLLPAAADGPSPRGDIAAAWRRLHGAENWRGLLDPLDGDLRREIVRYGELVDAAYGAFLARPDATLERPGRVQLPDASYRVTRPLFVTSSVELPRRLAAALPPWGGQRTSLVGYVAVCDDAAQVRRMGRREIVVALRGTATVLEWAENVRAGLVQATASAAGAAVPKVACGFRNLYTTAGDRTPSLSAMVVGEVSRLLKKYEGEEVSITVTGHSLGAALAVLIADELRGSASPPVAVFSFGGPRVGNRVFAARVEARGARVLRVVNAHDVVPRVPGAPLPAAAYAHVGRELRLDSRASPYLRPNADAACCHDLEAYLHLVDGFLGSHCPFRANAKRSILRLLKNQGGNVKQLYMSKAKDMRVRLDGGGAGGGCGVGRGDLPTSPAVASR